MVNKKAQTVIKRLEEENRTYTIKILGDEDNKAKGFYILMLTQQTTSIKENVFHGIKKKTLELLKEAEIKFKVI